MRLQLPHLNRKQKVFLSREMIVQAKATEQTIMLRISRF
jgi:hypothetical protein